MGAEQSSQDRSTKGTQANLESLVNSLQFNTPEEMLLFQQQLKDILTQVATLARSQPNMSAEELVTSLTESHPDLQQAIAQLQAKTNQAGDSLKFILGAVNTPDKTDT